MDIVGLRQLGRVDLDADALFIATDIDGLYSADPRSNPLARALDEVPELTAEVLAMAGGSGSSVGTGGMRTKLEAAAKAGAAGIETYLFNGRSSEVVRGLAQDRLRGNAWTNYRTSSARRAWTTPTNTSCASCSRRSLRCSAGCCYQGRPDCRARCPGRHAS
ncbi:hypothetical protein QUF31_21295 [Dickeya chrysanthemi]|uniref:amino acid kinase family protein n=1 Tax=Dickeya chrysanthemi TaxID=556 RepID=UPI0025A17D08|nr:hypothetical protein [Dickeya chrysanthemi]WJM85501.1 hypothetical protein QUF31_21295 [Dickeya chrysanthemi]